MPIDKTLGGQVHPLQAIGEAAFGVGLMLGFFLWFTQLPLLTAVTIIGVGSLGAVWCAFRARISDLPLKQALAQDGRLALLFILPVGLTVYLLFAFAARDFPFQRLLIQLTLGFVALDAVLLFFARLIWRAWRLWMQAQRKRLLWAIVHIHLLTAFVILLLILLVQSQRNLTSNSTAKILQATEGAAIILSISDVLSGLVTTVILAIPVLLILTALAAFVSTIVARPLVQRIEALAQAVSQFRQGAYHTRLANEGEDEIAQLSDDFNMMAATLEQTLTDLQTERDTVGHLLQTRRTLMASVSHELRTPVAIMRSYLEAHLSRWDDVNAPSETLRHDLVIIERETIRLQRLIDDLFALSRAEVGQLTLRCVPTDLRPIILHVIETMTPVVGNTQHVKIFADLPQQLPAVLSDAERLAQILLNLLHNGVHHTPPGGLVAISAQAHPTEVQITVADTGGGILPDDLPHIWESFYRGADGQMRQGAGLGLALVKTLVEAMAGRVAVHSEVGNGSQFHVYLPKTDVL